MTILLTSVLHRLAVIMVAVKVNEDLQREREKGTFNTEELTNLLDGGAEKTAERRELGEMKFYFNYLWLLYYVDTFHNNSYNV